MIVKNYELNEKLIKGKNFFLFYGNNEGFKREIIINLFTKNKIINHEEKEILENEENFINDILSKSLFDQTRTIVIRRCTDKICKIIDKIKEKNVENEILIFISESLEKKSKLRNLFEKNEKLICVPFYPDTEQTLVKLIHNFIRKKNISLSSESINLLINKSLGNREFLLNELIKIENFCRNGKKITKSDLIKLINLAENYGISDLINNYLTKNTKKITNILNENNFTSDDCIQIIRSLSIKSKKILKLSNEFQKSKNLDLIIDTAKPPIFWKDKEITKQQVFKWEPKKLKNLIYKLNETELLVKKNYNNSVNLVTNFLLEQTS
tara:strand:+ start:1589 stop:2563 length:975 start_codon:yes stop_codon:yes gene_type:complete